MALWNRRGVPYATAMAVFLFATVPAAVLRPLWYDEIATAWFGNAGTLAAFFDRLFQYVEPTPPAYLLTAFASVQLWGRSEFALRFPSLIGYGAALTFLYLLVARRRGPAAGVMAMGIFLLTGSLYYGHEARPFALLAGGAAMAMWAAQRYGEQPRRRWVVAVAGALLVASSLHYYGILLAVPFGLAALGSLVAQRRLNAALVAGMLAPPIPLLAHYPLIKIIMGAPSNPAYSWAKPTLAFPAKFWMRMLEPATFPAVAVLAVLFVLLVLRRPAPAPAPPPGDNALPLAEWVLLVGFLLLPVAGLVFAKLVTNAMPPRYVLGALLGFAAIAAHLLATIAGRYHNLLAAVLLILVAAGSVLDIRLYLREERPGSFPIPGPPETASLPVVVDDYLRYAQLGYYGTPEQLRRLVYVTDPQRLTRYTRAGQMELVTVVGIQAGQLNGKAAYLEPFLAQNTRFLLYEPVRADPEESFLSHNLIDRGARLQLLSLEGGRWFLVDAPPRPANN